MVTRRRSVRGRRTGQSVVEFALLLPLFLLVIVGGIVEFGVTFYNYVTLQQLANDGAQTAASAIRDVTQESAVAGTCRTTLSREARKLIGNRGSNFVVTTAGFAADDPAINVKCWQVNLEFRSPVWTPLYSFAMGMATDADDPYFTLRTRAVFPTKVPKS